jgi:hypothetical protein
MLFILSFLHYNLYSIRIILIVNILSSFAIKSFWRIINIVRLFITKKVLRFGHSNNIGGIVYSFNRSYKRYLHKFEPFDTYFTTYLYFKPSTIITGHFLNEPLYLKMYLQEYINGEFTVDNVINMIILLLYIFILLINILLQFLV